MVAPFLTSHSAHLAFKKLGLSPIRMNGMSRGNVERFVTGKGARIQAVERYDLSEGEFHSYWYIVVKGPVGSEHSVA
jgi:hypothetical protein